MRRARSVTSTASHPITVVQGAYEQFCTHEDRETTYACDPSAVYFFCLVAFALDVPETVVQTEADDWVRFQSLAEQWRAERGATSSITAAAMCPAYQSIIGMGTVALPFIFDALQAEGNDPDQWFWALKSIGGVEPVPEEDRGDFRAMAATWLKWGRDQGYAR